MSTNDLKQQVEQGIQSLSEQIENRDAALKKRIDELEKQNGRVSSVTKSSVPFEQELYKQLGDSHSQLSALKDGRQKEVRLQLKAGDMTTGNTYTGEVIAADHMPGVHFDPDRPNHIRQYIPQATTESDVVRHVEETGYNDGTAGQTEGEQKGQTDFDLEAKSTEVVTRATFLRVSRQMLDDTPFMVQYLNQRLPKKLFIDEDNQILYGDGQGNNVQGISGVAQSYSNVLEAGKIANRFDALINAVAQCRTENGEYVADRIFVNPIDYWNQALEKGDDGHYIHGSEIRSGNAPLRIAGVQVVPNTAVNLDEFFVGDFSMGATMAMREGINLRFFEQDANNVTENKVTVRIEERYALPIHNPNAFIFGDFTTALGT